MHLNAGGDMLSSILPTCLQRRPIRDGPRDGQRDDPRHGPRDDPRDDPRTLANRGVYAGVDRPKTHHQPYNCTRPCSLFYAGTARARQWTGLGGSGTRCTKRS